MANPVPQENPTANIDANLVIDRLSKRIAQLELDNTVLRIALEQAVSTAPMPEINPESDAE